MGAKGHRKHSAFQLPSQSLNHTDSMEAYHQPHGNFAMLEQIKLANGTSRCDTVPNLVDQYIEKLDHAWDLGKQNRALELRIKEIKMAMADYESLHENDDMGGLMPYIPSTGMQEGFQNLGDWAQGKGEGQSSSGGATFLRSLAAPLAVPFVFTYGVISGGVELGENLTDHARQAMGSDADRFTTPQELQALEDHLAAQEKRAQKAFDELEELRTRIVNMGCEGEESLQLIDEAEAEKLEDYETEVEKLLGTKYQKQKLPSDNNFETTQSDMAPNTKPQKSGSHRDHLGRDMMK